MQEVFRHALMPYFYPLQSNQPKIVANFQQVLQGVRINVHTKDSPLKDLSAEMQARLDAFYQPFNSNLLRTLYQLQQNGRVFAVPKIQSEVDPWWPHTGAANVGTGGAAAMHV